MPVVKIEILKGKNTEYKKAIVEGIHSALVEVFKIPDDDRNHRLYELDTENFEFPHNKSNQFTSIELTVFKGRSFEAKRNLYSAIIRNLNKNPGINGNDILIIINEPPMENWGIRGGIPANEVDLGFQINV